MIQTIADLPVDKFLDIILLKSTGQVGCPPTEYFEDGHCTEPDTCKKCWLKYIMSEENE